MSDKITPLEERIERFEKLLEEMKEETREAHSALKELKKERREIERILSSKETKQMVEDKVNFVVKAELDRIGPEIRERTNLIYDRVGTEIDRLISLSLGKSFAHQKGKEDLRPLLAEKLGEWIREIVHRNGG